jgi:hypothetical protein
MAVVEPGADPTTAPYVTDGRTRVETVAAIVDLAQRGPLVVGIDCSFSMPAWFAAEHGASTIDDVWALATDRGEQWLATCPEPFYGPRGRRRSIDVRASLRCTEHALQTRGLHPKSVFQLAGAGQVGPGSLRAMPLLAELRRAGAAIWPFDPPGALTIVEAWPTLLERRFGPASGHGTEHRADAAIIASALAQHPDPSAGAPIGTMADVAIEGWIWEPALDR